ncbi:MAG: hypothetical protein PHW47_02925 [Lachnospira sp.]|nr:hypothetical protein [Lachnospira sp.]
MNKRKRNIKIKLKFQKLWNAPEIESDDSLAELYHVYHENAHEQEF